ncbi:MAG: hypothetical protein JWQ47_2607, partial [Glaciihabitans sp.]|nr:hypothetical protein [Glaciihabitans sp.]
MADPERRLRLGGLAARRVGACGVDGCGVTTCGGSRVVGTELCGTELCGAEPCGAENGIVGACVGAGAGAENGVVGAGGSAAGAGDGGSGRGAVGESNRSVGVSSLMFVSGVASGGCIGRISASRGRREMGSQLELSHFAPAALGQSPYWDYDRALCTSAVAAAAALVGALANPRIHPQRRLPPGDASAPLRTGADASPGGRHGRAERCPSW